MRVRLDLDKLFQNSLSTSSTLAGHMCRIVIVAVNSVLVFVIGIIRPKHSITTLLARFLAIFNRLSKLTSKVFEMIFSIESADEAATDSILALVADEIQPLEIIVLA